jgi:anti-sigma-K factor RskA
MNEQEFAELAAGHALDALSPEDLAAFETARAAHPEWERLVVMDAATAASLADGVPAVQPPAAMRDTLLAAISETPQSAPVAESPVRLAEPAPDTATVQTVARRNWTRAMLGLAASLILLVALGFGAVTIRDLLTQPPEVAALAQIEAAPDAQAATAEVTDGGTATVHWSEEVGKVVLVSNGLPAIAADESFELWYVRDGVPISAGTFDDGGEATVLLEGTMAPGDVIAVTVEQQGGSPDGKPTTDPIVAIPTA